MFCSHKTPLAKQPKWSCLGAFLAGFVFPDLPAAQTQHLTFCCFMPVSIKLPGCPERSPGSCLWFLEMEWPEAARMGDAGLRDIDEYLRIFSSASVFFSIPIIN